VEPEIRDSVVERIIYLSDRTSIPIEILLKFIGLTKVKFYRWLKRTGIPNRHNGQIPKSHWLLPEEVEKIKLYAKEHYSNGDFFLRDGYRRLTYQMLDENIVAASPSSVYRILRTEGLLNKWNTLKKSLKGTGFNQPDYPHKHWHTDIKYLNFNGTFLFLIPVIDGYSRYIVHHEVRHTMSEYDVQLTIQKAKDKFPGVKPRIISDNGPQFISKEFKSFIKQAEFQHITTSVKYPESNGKIERFNRTISEECLRVKSPITFDDYRIYVEDYINFYNTKRLHSSLNYLTPDDYLLGRKDERLKQRELKLQMAEEHRKRYWEKSVSAA
jgi:putative transposase